jgi:GT2 family glycosyltransferase
LAESLESLQDSLLTARNKLQPQIKLLNRVSKKVSIVIPNYNGQKYLEDCLDSLHCIDFLRDDYEILVVDNASTDTSREFLQFAYPDVILIQSKQNLGFAKGCNLGIKKSSGEYIVLLNNDTVVERDWLKELVAVADRDANVAIVGSKLLFKNRPNEIQNAMSYLNDRGDGGDIGTHQTDEGQYDSTREAMTACGASMLIKRTLIDDIGALDEDFFAYYEDVDLCYRARLYGKKIMFAHKSIVYHVHSATSIEWSPLFTFLVLRNKLLLHVKNSPVRFVLKVLLLYAYQVIYQGLFKGINRRIHLEVIGSFTAQLPRFLLKRFYIRYIVKRKEDGLVLLRLTKAKSKVNASSVKKICIYNAYLPTMGGGENLTAHTVAYLNSIFPSASIDILCHETKAFEKSQFAGKEFVQMLEREFKLTLRNTNIRYVNFNFNIKNFIGNVRYLLRISSLSEQYDLFINNTFFSLAPARAKVNIYYCMFPVNLNYSMISLLGPLRRVFYNNFLSSYELFLSISQYTQKWVDSYWAVNSFVLYPPVKTEKRPVNLDKDNTIINVGRFFAGGHNKKQDVLIKAFIDMYDKGWVRDWSLILVGRKHADEESSSYIRSLEEIAKGYPVELRYDTSIEDLQSLLAKAKIYWHATGYEEAVDKNPDKFEHFGLSTIEAAQFGAVPVVINGGGQPEIINHGSNGFLWNTIDELEDFTKLLMEDNMLWKNLSNATIDSMKIFGVETQFHWFKLFLSPYYELEQ